MPRSNTARNSPLSIAYIDRLARAGVEKLSTSQQEVVARFNAAWAEVRAEREAAGQRFFQQRGRS